MNDIYWIIIFIISIIASASPVLLVKEYINTNKFIYIIIAIMSYFILLLTYIYLFKRNEISKIYSLIKIVQLLLVSVIAIQLYNEKINENKIIGFGAGIISIIYLSLS